MAFSPENRITWVDSGEYSHPITTAAHPPFRKGTRSLTPPSWSDRGFSLPTLRARRNTGALGNRYVHAMPCG